MADDAPDVRPSLPTRRTLLLCLAFLAPCTVIALSVWSIERGLAKGAPLASTASGVGAAPSSEPLRAVAAPDASATPSVGETEASLPVFDEGTDDGEPSAVNQTAPKHFATVQQAAAESCSTSSVDGLSRQIIAQARCIAPNAFVPLPTRPNLVLASQVFPYLELGARNRLLQALDAHATLRMTINSALRTVAQQYLVWRWGAGKRCGVQLATPPGESNHEVGTALDIAEAAQWRSVLEAYEFHWLGASDRVHFDYLGGASSTRGATDVLAFQMLWNRNHPQDAITADGHYNPATEQRLKKAPSDGFAVGPSCGKARTPKP